MKLEERLQEMSRRLTGQIVAVNKLAVAFTQESRDLLRHDQAASLRILKTRIINAVDHIEQMEVAARDSHNKTSLVNDIGTFVVGSLLSPATGISDQPSKFGLGHALAGVSKAIPYSRVLIAVGREGLPDSVSIVPVSRVARESSKVEPEVEASLKDDGYLLMSPEKFGELLDKVKQAVLNGSVSLPINIDKLTE